MDKNQSREISSRIRTVLLKEWDPIGVADIAEAQDEYDSYVGEVFELLIKKFTEGEIAKYLYNRETRHMGLSFRAESELLPVARSLLKITFAD